MSTAIVFMLGAAAATAVRYIVDNIRAGVFSRWEPSTKPRLPPATVREVRSDRHRCRADLSGVTRGRTPSWRRAP